MVLCPPREDDLSLNQGPARYQASIHSPTDILYTRTNTNLEVDKSVFLDYANLCTYYTQKFSSLLDLEYFQQFEP